MPKPRDLTEYALQSETAPESPFILQKSSNLEISRMPSSVPIRQVSFCYSLALHVLYFPLPDTHQDTHYLVYRLRARRCGLRRVDITQMDHKGHVLNVRADPKVLSAFVSRCTMIRFRLHQGVRRPNRKQEKQSGASFAYRSRQKTECSRAAASMLMRVRFKLWCHFGDKSPLNQANGPSRSLPPLLVDTGATV